jgi:ABC-type phosphate transport system substrate-binding protein
VAKADLVVIVSVKCSVYSLSAEQVTRIFLGKDDKFPTDQFAVAVDQQEGSSIRDDFYSKVAHKNSSQISSYWAKLIFTGEGRLPKTVSDDSAVIKYVVNNSNAVGYVDDKSLIKTISKKIRIVFKP